MHRGVDIYKPHRSNLEIYGCWAHDTWHPSGAHCDIVQIVTQAGNTIIHWNNFQGFNAPDSPSSAGGRSSRSEEHTSELQSLMRISYAVFCLTKKKKYTIILTNTQ